MLQVMCIEGCDNKKKQKDNWFPALVVAPTAQDTVRIDTGVGNERRHKIVLDEYYWNYSRTTSKYRNEFLGFGVDECRKRIADGTIKLANLNRKSS